MAAVASNAANGATDVAADGTEAGAEAGAEVGTDAGAEADAHAGAEVGEVLGVAAAAVPAAEAVPVAVPEFQIEVGDVFTLARQQNFPAVKALFSKMPELATARDEEGHTLLHWACLVNHNDFVSFALERGIDMDALANNMQSPLMWASLRGHIPCMRSLLTAKANAKLHDSMGATALIIAVQHRQYLAMLLMMHRAGQDILGDVDKNACSAAHWAAYKGDETALRLLDYFGEDLLAFDQTNMQPLHRAVWASQAGVVKFLVDKRCDVMARNKEGKNCIDLAVQQEDVGMQTLLQKLSNSDGFTEIDPEAVMEEARSKTPKKREGFMRGIMKDKSLHIMFPIFWLVCVSLAIFQYLMDLRPVGWESLPIGSMCFEFFVPASLACFALVVFSDPGKMPKRPRGQTGVEELMRQIDSDEMVVPDLARSFSRLCTTTWVLKDLRTKYCTQTCACVREFDHYCVWLNVAIGRGNHRQFVVLAVIEFFAQVSHLYLLVRLGGIVVPYESFGSWIWTAGSRYPLMVLIFIAHLVTAPWVFMLTVHQCRLIGQNLTTNEMMNMHRYEHFWPSEVIGPGRMSRIWRNPFNKGSFAKNALDFWWKRRRSEFGPVQASKACSHGCAHHHHH